MNVLAQKQELPILMILPTSLAELKRIQSHISMSGDRFRELLEDRLG
jgi:hypothetical protein